MLNFLFRGSVLVHRKYAFHDTADGHQRNAVSRATVRRIKGHETAFRFGQSVQSNEKGQSVG